MESLTQLLDTCSLPEKTQLVEYAKIKNSPSSKKLMLMKLFVSHPGLSDTEYSQKIYKKPDSAAYFQLKKRVKDEFQALFIFLKPICLKKEIQLHIKCSELLLKSELILARGIKAEGSKLLERGLKMAIKNGFHDLILTIYSTAMRFELYEVISNKDLPELEIAIKSHLQLLIKKNYKKPDEQIQSKNQHLKEMIRKLNYSRNSRFLLDDIHRSIQNKEYKYALSQVTTAESELARDIEPITRAELLITKMSIFLAQREFSKLLTECNASIDISNFSPENALKHALNQWHALFHLKQLDDAQQVLRKNLMKMDSVQNPKWAYMEACIYFRQRALKPALQQIHACQKDLKSIHDYYLGSKMLELMILFDQNDQDWLEYKIENLRKLISRNKSKINRRIDVAFQLFSKLQKSLHKSDLAYIAQDSLLINLQKESVGLEWIPDSFELIRFDNWVLTLLNNKSLR